MALYEYAKSFDAAHSSRSQRYDINASYKDLCQVCAAIKGKPLEKAVNILEEAIELKMPIPFRKFNTGMGHRSQLGGRKGKFPKKECAIMLEMLENAAAGALGKGIEEKNAIVLHAQAYKQNVLPRYRRFFASSHTLGYGKQAVFSNYSTARVELVLGDKDAKELPRKTNKQLAKEKKERKQAARKTGEKKETAEVKETKAEKKEEKTMQPQKVEPPKTEEKKVVAKV